MAAGAGESAVEPVSRICVKNVPAHVDAGRLRDHFSARGEVTDAKVLRTQDGRSRQIAFIGFKTPQQAQDAVAFFSRTFLDTSRLSVELATPVSAASERPRPWSKYSAGSSAHAASVRAAEPPQPPPTARQARKLAKAAAQEAGAKKSTRAVLPPEAEADPRLEEYLRLVQPRHAQKLWTDEAGGVAHAPPQQPAVARSDAPGAAGASGSDDDDEEEYQELEPRVAVGAGAALEDDDEEDAAAAAERARALDGLDDKAYLKSRVRTNWDEEDEEEEEEEEGGADDAGADAGEEGQPQVGAPPPEAAPASDGPQLSSTRLFLRNLAFSATEEELRALCSPYGALSSVHLVTDRTSGTSKGFAYVEFETAQDADAALAALDRSTFQGRLLHVLRAQPRPGATVVDVTAQHGKDRESFKAAKEAALRASAGDVRSWSALFVRPDTVAAWAAARFGATKADVLDPGSGDAAARLALAEAQLVAEMQRELSEWGVDTEKLIAAAASRKSGGAAVERSDTVLLLKNLPASADERELRSMAQRFGPLARLLLPSSKALALLEFTEPSHARAAFAGLAYSRYQHVSLYCEWAPQGLLSPAPLQAPAAEEPAPGGAAPRVAGAEEAEEESGSSTLFVKNLSFVTTDESLLRHAKAQLPRGTVRTASVSKRPGKAPGSVLSAGFGFVELSSPDDALAAVRALDGSTLDGHVLHVQRSRGTGAAAPETALPGRKAAQSTKLVVRNVAFEATKKDLHALFSPFGAVKSLRLPRKFDGSHRGFAFVEMTTKAEAAEAFTAVGRTHLYGRRLVTEWAAPDEDGVDALRARTAERFAAATQPAGKKQRRA